MILKKNIDKIKSTFKEKGYVKVSGLFSKKQIDDLLNSSKDIEQIASSGFWKYIKIYREYPKIKHYNVFGVEYPLHQNLNANTYKAFCQLNYKNFFCKILGWTDLETTLIRLHLNSNFFKYQGEWHRDNFKFPSPDKVQAVIYLQDENGFKIIPRDKNHLLQKKHDIPEFGPPEQGQGFRKLEKNIYDVIDAKKGDMLIFEAGLLHQGFVKGSRYHYHVRHEKKNFTEKLDESNIFNFTRKYLPNYDLSKEFYAEHYFQTSFKLKLIRLKTLFFYFLPRLKFIYKNFFSKKSKKNTIFHSTIWQ